MFAWTIFLKHMLRVTTKFKKRREHVLKMSILSKKTKFVPFIFSILRAVDNLSLLWNFLSIRKRCPQLSDSRSCHLEFCESHNKLCLSENFTRNFWKKGVWRYHFCVSQNDAWKSKNKIIFMRRQLQETTTFFYNFVFLFFETEMAENSCSKFKSERKNEFLSEKEQVLYFLN